MSPFLSTKGKSLGKLLEGYRSSTIGQGMAVPPPPIKDTYFGDGSDGNISTSGLSLIHI